MTDQEKPTDENEAESIVEQVEEAVEAVEEALDEGDTAHADKILRQLETWQKDRSSTLEKAIQSALSPILDEVKNLRAELEKAKRSKAEKKPEAEPIPKPPLKAPSPEEAPTPHTDTSLTGDPESGGRGEPDQPPSERKSRRWI